MNLDAHASARFEVSGAADIGYSTGLPKRALPTPALAPSPFASPAVDVTGRDLETELERRAATGSISGCFEILAGLDVNVGASAALLNIWKGDTSLALFSKDWELFKVRLCPTHLMRNRGADMGLSFLCRNALRRRRGGGRWKSF